MELLPKSNQDFAHKDYWEKFFQKRGGKAFEWYGEYLELCDQLHKYIKIQDDILIVGCGNSKLSMDLYDVGFRKITNIDISSLVINQMTEKNKSIRPNLIYIQMDATKMTFENQEFSVVLDKGTLDALMPDESEESENRVRTYFDEIIRVLRNGGRYVCISLLQEHIIKMLVNYFPQHNSMFRVIRCNKIDENQSNSKNTSMPVFIIVATKFDKLNFTILEISMSNDKIVRLKSPEEIILNVLDVQKAALVCNALQQGNIVDLDEISMDLFKPGESTPRFTINIVDQKQQRGNGKFAIFIVPQGRETEWIFSTPEGRKKLTISSKHNRLAIVSMHREQHYTTWDDVKSELSQSMINLAPQDCVIDQIPYLSIGSEVGSRDVIFKGHSDISGDYIIEEFSGQDGKIFRRLIFLSNQFVVQSEALVKLAKTKKTMEKLIDPNYLACDHHLYMTLGVNVVKETKEIKNKSVDVVVIGLGGGGLCTFIHNILKNVNITAVDIDAAMLKVATKFFGLIQDARLNVVIDDGITFLKESAKNGKKFDSVLFDVDSKDTRLGMSCPPKNFLEQDTLNDVKTCIGDKGLLILNLVCRNEKLRDEVIENLKKSFKFIYSYRLEEDVNEILFLKNTDQSSDIDKVKNELEMSTKSLNKYLKKIGNNYECIDVEQFLNDLQFH